MKKILVLGAGHSAPHLIRYLLDEAEALDATVTVADVDAAAAARRIDGHPRGSAIAFDVTDDAARRREVAEAEVVVHLLPPKLQAVVAEECVAQGTHMVSASYRSKAVRALDAAAAHKGVALLCELGLDPGLDVMSGERLISRLQEEGGEVERFCSYGGGLPAPGEAPNPLSYVVTWNPRNVVMAASSGACYLRRGEVHLLPWERTFASHWPVEVPGLGTMEAYANRDSLTYRTVHGIESARTVVRATLRYPGWCDFWRQVVRLGLPNEEIEIPGWSTLTWRQLVAMCLPDREILADVPGAELPDEDVRGRVAAFLGLPVEDEGVGKLEWLGLFSDEPLGGPTPAEALVALLERKLKLEPPGRDLVVLHHEVDVRYAAEKRRERVLSTFLHTGEPGGATAMAQGVGLPAALAVKLLVLGELDVAGSLIPTHPKIYEPILDALEGEGLVFREEVRSLPWDD